MTFSSTKSALMKSGFVLLDEFVLEVDYRCHSSPSVSCNTATALSVNTEFVSAPWAGFGWSYPLTMPDFFLYETPKAICSLVPPSRFDCCGLIFCRWLKECWASPAYGMNSFCVLRNYLFSFSNSFSSGDQARK